MKKIRFAILGYTDVFNPKTSEVEQRESVAYCTIDYSSEAEKDVKEKAYHGDYEIYDDGEPKAEPSDTERIAELEDAINLLLEGSTE